MQSELGALPVQDLTRRHIDDLIVKLRSGELVRPGGRARKAWSARSCNYMLGALSQVLAQLVAEGRLTRNVASLVYRVPGGAKKFETFTPDQVRTVLGGIADDRNRHAWHLALAGLRRGEIAGQRWADIDSQRRTLRIGATRVDVGGRAFDQDEPKTANAGRVLPIPDALLAELSAAKNRQAAEKLALGDAYSDQGFVVCNEAGEPYHPSTLSTLWQAAIRDLDVPQIRLHDARPSCICRACPSPLSRRGSATPTCRSLYAPTCTLSLRRWNSPRGALLRKPPPPGTDALAHACGDSHPDLVTICDNFGRVERPCDQCQTHTTRSRTSFGRADRI